MGRQCGIQPLPPPTTRGSADPLATTVPDRTSPPVTGTGNSVKGDGDKFVLSGTTRLPVDRKPIIGEDDIGHLAVPSHQAGTLTGPDEEGFLEGTDYKLWIEGERGFYAVDRFNLTTREMKVEGMDPSATQALRYHHALQNRHLIEKAISEFAITRSLSFDNELRDRLYWARSAMSRHLYEIKNWEELSPLQQQYADAKAQAWLQHAFIDDLAIRPVGLCGEHAGLAFQVMPSDMKRDGSMTRITFREYPGSGRNHQALLIARSPDIILPFFGDITKRGANAAQDLFTRSRAEFAKYLYDNREHLLIVDTWGSQRLIDINRADSPDDALREIYKNLSEAGFGRGYNIDFSVSASAPKRSALTYL